MQTFSLPKNSKREWTEWFKGFDGNKEKINSVDYDVALQEVDMWMRSENGMTASKVSVLDQVLKEAASLPATEEESANAVILRGQPWGALEQLRVGGAPLTTSGLHFSLPVFGEVGFEEVKPWKELLSDAETFSASTLSALPVSYLTNDAWLAIVQSSADNFGMTWLHALYIGIAQTERGMVSEPLSMFQTSLLMKPNPIAARCIACTYRNFSEVHSCIQ